MNETPPQTNRALWDRWTQLHMTPESDYAEPLARFRAGGITLKDVEQRRQLAEERHRAER